MAGNQSRGLIAASKTKGWDPTVIPAGNGKPQESLTTFDVDQGNLPGYPVGRFPAVPDGWPDDLGVNVSPGVTEPSFASPQLRENLNHRTKNSNPFAGM